MWKEPEALHPANTYEHVWRPTSEQLCYWKWDSICTQSKPLLVFLRIGHSLLVHNMLHELYDQRLVRAYNRPAIGYKLKSNMKGLTCSVCVVCVWRDRENLSAAWIDALMFYVRLVLEGALLQITVSKLSSYCTCKSFHWKLAKFRWLQDWLLPDKNTGSF